MLEAAPLQELLGVGAKPAIGVAKMAVDCVLVGLPVLSLRSLSAGSPSCRGVPGILAAAAARADVGLHSFAPLPDCAPGCARVPTVAGSGRAASE